MGARPLWLVVRDGRRVGFVAVVEIDPIESAGNDAIFHAPRDTRVVRETMSALEDFPASTAPTCSTRLRAPVDLSSWIARQKVNITPAFTQTTLSCPIDRSAVIATL